MARKAKTDIEEPIKVAEQSEAVEEVAAEAAADATVAEKPEVKVEEEVAEETEAEGFVAVAGPAVSPAITKLLRTFNSYDELYISKTGGVFPKGHLPSRVKDAVLYKNPFYKNIN